MTAMFVVIFLEQWFKEKHHLSAYIGIFSSVLCLFIFGADGFYGTDHDLRARLSHAFQKAH